MLKAAFDLRIATADIFSKLDCYSDILKVALYIADTLDREGRGARYRQLFRAFTHGTARREIAKAYLLGPHSTVEHTSAWLKKTVPWPIQKMFMRISGKGLRK